MKTIKVCDFLGIENLLSPNKGKVLREEILRILSLQDTVVSDFDGYKYISGSFVNESIGKLCIQNRWSEKTLRKKVTWKNLSDDDEIDILIAIENAQTKIYLIDKNIPQDQFYQQNLHAC
jgi:hypothetical protein